MEQDHSIKYSVIVPVYNGFDFLLSIIEWFSRQYSVRKDIELVVVDDGSTDICSYSHDWPGVRWFRKSNGGVSAARNYGLSQSRGDYVSFLDSDDSYSEDFFSLNDALITSYDNPDLILNSYSIVNGKSIEYIRNSPCALSSEVALRQFFLKETRIHICALVLKRDWLIRNELSFNESIGYTEDVLFIVEAVNACEKVVLGGDLVYEYILREGSAVNRRVSSAWLRSFLAYDEILALNIPDNLLYVRKFFISTCYVNFYQRCLRLGVEEGLDVAIRESGSKYIYPYFGVGKYYFLNIAGAIFFGLDRLSGGLLMRTVVGLRKGRDAA